MRIRRLLVRNFRGIDEQEVRFASEGVTVLVGPNETGKSSLAEAFDLLIEFPDSSGHSRVRSVKPVHRDEGPEVEADIEAGEYSFTYGKRFLRRAHTNLEIHRPAHENLTGREAHERALAILAEVADLDLWRALRIQQGAELDLPHLAGRSSLAAALDRAAGESRAGEAEESLFDAIRAEFERYHTSTQGKLKAEHRAVQDEVERARAGLDASNVELAGVEHTVIRSGELSRRAGEIEKEVAELAETASRRQADWELLRGRVAELENLRERSASAQARLADAERQLAERKQLAQRVKSAKEDLESRTKDLGSLGPELDRLRAISAGAEESLVAEEQAVADRNRRHSRCRDDFEFLRAKLDLDQLTERFERAEAAVSGAVAAQQSLDNCTIDDSLLEEIRQAHLDAERAKARTEAASASLKLEALDDLRMLIDAEPVDVPRGDVVERKVTDAFHVELPEKLRLSVKAGGEAGDLLRAQSDAEGRLADLLARSKTASLAEAARANESRKDAERKVADRDRLLEENLRDLSREDLARKIRNLGARIAEYPLGRDADLPVPETFDEAQARLRESEEKLREAQSSLEAARIARSEAAGSLSQLEERRRTEEAELQTLMGRLGEGEALLSAARRNCPDDGIEASVAAARELHEEALRAVREVGDAVLKENPEGVQLLAENAVATLRESREEQRRIERDLSGVEAELRLLGERGLSERVEEARADLYRAERRWRSLERRARAARVLFEVFEEKRAEARRAYVEPLAKRIRDLGAVVFGSEFQVTLTDDLAVESRTMGGRTVPFADLSGGAKEQVSLLARLACALTVAEDGGVPLILDDALGYTDPARLESMGAVLSLAGRSCQVIVMTCVPERYRHVGEKEVVPFD